MGEYVYRAQDEYKNGEPINARSLKAKSLYRVILELQVKRRAMVQNLYQLQEE